MPRSRCLGDSQSVQGTPEKLEGFVQVGLVVARPVLSTIVDTFLKPLSHESFRSCPSPVLCDDLVLILGTGQSSTYRLQYNSSFQSGGQSRAPWDPPALAIGYHTAWHLRHQRIP